MERPDIMVEVRAAPSSGSIQVERLVSAAIFVKPFGRRGFPDFGNERERESL
jgi:hypothetical protein